MLKQSYKIFGILLVVMMWLYGSCLLASPALFTKPGNEMLLEQTQLDGVLYVSNVSVSEDSELKGIELTWIPESVRAECMGKNGAECRQLWHEKASQRHNLFLQSQKNIPVSERNLNYSFGTDEKNPSEVLSTLVSQEDLDPSNKKAFDQISQLDFIKNLCQTSPRGETTTLISEDKKIRAKIRYLQFSNGQSFQIIDIINF